jgi:hypothetical protein
VDITNLLTDITTVVPEDASVLREILSHELGHFLTRVYIKNHVKDSWMTKHFEKDIECGINDIDLYMVTEGIGEYFGKIFNREGVRFATSRWNDLFDITDFQNKNFIDWLFYKGGRDFVEPILDIDPNQGLIWLLKNELVVVAPDLKSVLKYKEKGINELSISKLEKELLENNKKLNPEFLEDYLRLMKLNAPMSLIVDIEENHLREMANGIESGRFPLKLFNEYEIYSLDYSVRAARRDPDFSKGEIWAKDFIKSELDKREHVFRLDTDYQEDSGQIATIKDNYILFLIKRNIDFFNQDKNWEDITKLFSEDNEEKGGFIIDNNGKNEIVVIPNRDSSWDNYKLESYSSEPSDYYAQYLSPFHIHPRNFDKHLETYAGPSGKARVFEGDVPYSDILASRIYSQMNPFNINTLITELEKGKYNVDIYFRDLENIKGKAVKDKIVTVIDLGVYQPNSPNQE